MVWDCKNTKGTSSDEFDLGFIKVFWKNIKGNVMEGVHDFQYAIRKWL